MKRPMIFAAVLSLVIGSPVSPVYAQGAFLSEARSTCSSELATYRKNLIEMQGFTAEEADTRQINPRIESNYTLPAYALRIESERVNDSELNPLMRCVAKLRLGQVRVETEAKLAAAKSAPIGDCSRQQAQARAFAPGNAELEDLLRALDAKVKGSSVAELNEATATFSDPDHPASFMAPLMICRVRTELATRSGAATKPATQTPSASPVTPAARPSSSATAPANLATVNQCVTPLQPGPAGGGNLYGSMQNICGFPISVVYCIKNPAADNTSTQAFNCDKGKMGLDTIGANARRSTHVGDTGNFLWIACRQPATPQTTYSSASGLMGSCK